MVIGDMNLDSEDGSRVNSEYRPPYKWILHCTRRGEYRHPESRVLLNRPLGKRASERRQKDPRGEGNPLGEVNPKQIVNNSNTADGLREPDVNPFSSHNCGPIPCPSQLLCLSVCLSLSLCVSFCLSVSVSLSFSPSVSPSLSLSLSLLHPVCLSLCVSFSP